MSIDINSTNSNAAQVAANASKVQPAQREPADSAETGRPSTADTLSLTEAASQLQRLAKQAEATPVVDTQKVESIRQAIADGSYDINPARIAERLLSLEAALYGSDVE
ncbi:MAG: flagellar biosynthesis anti-sigma factor FlgM [Gammaproteobacteria bacterium]|nr:flagellar biosynthesis anti-sigma factor FlgM [Gammaproteobacteria bacterium]